MPNAELMKAETLESSDFEPTTFILNPRGLRKARPEKGACSDILASLALCHLYLSRLAVRIITGSGVLGGID